jgi:hypothetical protein
MIHGRLPNLEPLGNHDSAQALALERRDLVRVDLCRAPAIDAVGLGSGVFVRRYVESIQVKRLAKRNEGA